MNVQFRIRLLTPNKAIGTDVIVPAEASARDPNTSQTYESVSQQSTNAVSLFMMGLQKQTTADAYVWLQVPEGINTINIYIPDTQAFNNVPIANQ